LNESLLLQDHRLHNRGMLHRQEGQALPQEGLAQASLERENAAELSAARLHQGVLAVELMHQSRPSRERRARQQELVRLVRKKGVRSDKAGRVPRVRLPGSQRVERRLLLSAVRDNRNGERKRERGLQRRGRNQARRTTDYADLTDF
jgi:hypothetical protein